MVLVLHSIEDRSSRQCHSKMATLVIAFLLAVVLNLITKLCINFHLSDIKRYCSQFTYV